MTHSIMRNLSVLLAAALIATTFGPLGATAAKSGNTNPPANNGGSSTPPANNNGGSITPPSNGGQNTPNPPSGGQTGSGNASGSGTQNTDLNPPAKPGNPGSDSSPSNDAGQNNSQNNSQSNPTDNGGSGTPTDNGQGNNAVQNTPPADTGNSGNANGGNSSDQGNQGNPPADPGNGGDHGNSNQDQNNNPPAEAGQNGGGTPPSDPGQSDSHPDNQGQNDAPPTDTGNGNNADDQGRPDVTPPGLPDLCSLIPGFCTSDPGPGPGSICDIAPLVCSGDGAPGDQGNGGAEKPASVQTGTLTVKLVVVGSEAAPDGFSFSVDKEGSVEPSDHGFDADGQNDLTVAVGAYTISANEQTDYAFSYDGCDHVAVGKGKTATCTITATYVGEEEGGGGGEGESGATIHLVKNTDGADGTFNFTVSDAESTTVATPQITTMEGTGSTDIKLDESDTYTLTENDTDGWTFSSVSCEYHDEGVGESVTHGEELSLANGAEVTCTFKNTAVVAQPTTGTLHVLTVITGGPASSTDFAFQVNGGDPAAFEADGQNDVTLEAGAYAVTETAVANYTTAYSEGCTGSLAAGGEATCTITNTYSAPVVRHHHHHSRTADGEVLGVSTGPQDSQGEVLGASCPLITSYLREGGVNDRAQVMSLQTFLNGEVNALLPVTGFYGPLTTSAVKNFQLKYWQDVLAPWVPFGLANDHAATGNVYKMTAWKINTIACPELNLEAPKLP